MASSKQRYYANEDAPRVSTVLLKRLGFDQSYYNRRTGYYKVKCSQCEATVINSTPCHETGCPNKPS